MASNHTTPPGRKLQSEDVHALLREFQAMVSAGVPLSYGLKNSAHGLSMDLEQVAQRLADRLEQGNSISEACRLEPGLPSELRPVLIAGFRCGSSLQVVQDILEMSRVQHGLRRSVQHGLVYPVTITLTAIILFGVVVSQFLSRIVDMYHDLHAQAPWWMSRIFQIASGIELSWFLIGAFAAVVLAVYLLLRPGAWFVIFPGMRRVDRDLRLSHMSQLLSLLTSHDIPLPESLRLAGDAAVGQKLQQNCHELASLIERGEPIESALSAQVAFPEFLKWLVVTGHHHSELPIALRDAAQFYQSRAESRARRFGRIFPLLTVSIIGGGVTFAYVLTVFGPMTDLWKKLAQY